MKIITKAVPFFIFFSLSSSFLLEFYIVLFVLPNKLEVVRSSYVTFILLKMDSLDGCTFMAPRLA